MRTINVDEKDVALILRDNGKSEVILTSNSDKSRIPKHEMLIVSLATLLRNKEFSDIVIQQFLEIVSEADLKDLTDDFKEGESSE